LTLFLFLFSVSACESLFVFFPETSLSAKFESQIFVSTMRDFFLSLRFTLSRDKTLPETSSLCFLSLLLVTSVSAFNSLAYSVVRGFVRKFVAVLGARD
jgi:hypothetical protein